MLFVFETIKVLVSGTLSSSHSCVSAVTWPQVACAHWMHATVWQNKQIAGNIHIISLFPSGLEGCQLSGTGNK